MGISLSLISHLGHKTQECAPDIHQASLHVILQSLTFRFCGATTGFFFLGHRPNHWYIAMSFRQSELSDKLWFPMITPVPSLQHSSICKIVHVENCQCCDFKTAVTLISGTAAFAYPFPVFLNSRGDLFPHETLLQTSSIKFLFHGLHFQ